MLCRVGAFGATLQVECPDEMRSWLSAALTSSCRVENVSGDSVWGISPDASFTVCSVGVGVLGGLRQGGEVVFETDDSAELERRVLSELHLAVAVHARDGVFVHAGAVAWRGVGIVIPARSMSGKTTLVGALVDAGAAYLSDEYAVLDDAGSVHPYPKPMCVREADGTSRFVSVADPAAGPVPVGVVVSSSYLAGAVWEPATTTGASVVLPLVDNTVAARLAPERMLEVCAAVGRQAVCWSGPRPDASVTAVLILERVDALLADEGVG